MVLKRLFATVLGALGLGALAAGTAFGQTNPGDGNIPAPDLFDDQITCSNSVPLLRGMGTDVVVPMPTVVPTGEETTPLDDLIGMGSMKMVIDTDATGTGTYEDLIYVVPPGGQNCGGSNDPAETDNPAFTNMAQGSIATDVAHGYSATLTAFEKVYGTGGTKSDVDDARKALNDAIDADESDTRLEDLREELADAQAADRKARAALDAVSQGPIYQAGIAEWMAKGAVETAVTKWNDAVQKVTNDDDTGTQDVLDAAEYRRDTEATEHTRGYIALRADPTDATLPQAVGRVVNTDGSINYSNLRDYVSQADDGEDAADNFDDDTQRLSLPMSDDPDSEDPDDMVPTRITATVATIRADREAANKAVEALTKALAENENPQRTNILTEGLRRARLEAAHLNEQWADALADNMDLVTDEEIADGDDAAEQRRKRATQGEQSIRTYNAANQRALSARDDAEDSLREAVADRVAATEAVVRAFTSPASFYQQLVDRRQSLHDEDNNAVAEASEDGATPHKSLTDAAAKSGKALDAARKAQEDFQALYDNAEDPVKELIDELLIGGGDDGQALVDAISGSYDTANEAKTRADEVAEQITGLTGDEGAVAMNTERSMQNATDIEGLDGRVTANEAEIGMDENGMSRIDHNEARSTMNRTMIMTNTENIATNAGNIMSNTTHIMENRGMIETNAADIMTNAGNIMSNTAHIMENRGMIDTNTGAIAALGNRVGSNESAIMRNSGMISDLNESLEVVRAGVAASMALAGMPAINGRGISIGVGSYDGESAFAVGFMIQGEMASFKVGVTSAGGETGASAGVGFQF